MTVDGHLDDILELNCHLFHLITLMGLNVELQLGFYMTTDSFHREMRLISADVVNVWLF